MTTDTTTDSAAEAAAPKTPLRAPSTAAAGARRAIAALGGFLSRCRDDLSDAVLLGWGQAAPWVRVLAVILSFGFITYVAGSLAAIAWPVLGPVADTATGALHLYLDQHTEGLQLDSSAAFTAWMSAGALFALVATLSTSAVARLAWTGWSAATLAAVWQASPDGSRPVATALTAAVLAGASVVALHGLTFSLRPRITVHNTVENHTPPPTAWPARPAKQRVPGPFDMN
ncbi:hypothetical protein [Kitasatospora griseola]|uniref:hypothetical protein n=1 Tax=Kitasatospora griseola TaxID=2064 RepID=UPI0034256B3E